MDTIVIIAVIFALVLASSFMKKKMDEGLIDTGYKHISVAKAKEMMAKDDDHLIVDVRTKEEYDEGHVPGAINVPNERIFDIMPTELSKLDQILLVYCRSGRRSREACSKLARIGYTNVYNFGGIQDWDGDIEK